MRHSGASQNSTEERLQRALHENAQLKRERVELQDKLKRVKTQFRSLVEEWSLLQRSQPTSAASHGSKSAKLTTPVPPLPPSRSAPKQPHGGPPSSSSEIDRQAAAPNRVPSDSHEACAQLQRALDAREAELQQAHAQLQRMEHAMQDKLRDTNNAAPTFNAASRLLESEYKLTLDRLTGERDALTRRVSELEAPPFVPSSSSAGGHMDKALMQLQTDVRERRIAAATLQHALQLTQGQLEMLQCENTRLREERVAAHATQSELQKKLFQSEAARGVEETLRRTVDELEQSVQEKNTALTRLEQELLRTVHTMQHHSRESELAVRQEYAERLAELQAMRDVAHEEQQRSEWELRECRQLREELQHTVSLLRSELSAEKERGVAAERALAEARAQAHAAERRSQMSSGLSEAEMEEAVAVARMIRRRRDMQASAAEAEENMNDMHMKNVRHGANTRTPQAHGTSNRDTAARLNDTPHHTGDVHNGPDAHPSSDSEKHNAKQGDARRSATQAPEWYSDLVWDETWESAQLREALAHATLEQELAEARAAQATAAMQRSRELQQRVAAERDTLWAECAELRQRMSHVETVFAAQQRCAYEAARASLQRARADGAIGDEVRRAGSNVGAQIDLCVCGIYAPCAHQHADYRPPAVQSDTHAQGDDVHASAAAALYRALGVSGPDTDPLSLFFTLDDGWAMYQTMMSPVFHHLGDLGEVHFTYGDIDPDEVTFARLCRSSFVLQLHRVLGGGSGSESELVAMGELPGTALLAGRGGDAGEDWVTLMDGSGASVARVRLRVSSVGLLLPVMLTRPLRQSVGADERARLPYSDDAVAAAVMALRSVRALRVRLFEARDLPYSLDGIHPMNTKRIKQGTQHVVVQEEDAEEENKGKENRNKHEGGTTVGVELLPQPYVFYTAHHPSFTTRNSVNSGDTCEAVSCIRDTVVYPANPSFTVHPVFDACPVDHRVGLVDAALVRFLEAGTIVFVLFDARARDARANLGMVELPLRPMLASPTAVMHETRALHPQGSLTVGISWLTGP